MKRSKQSKLSDKTSYQNSNKCQTNFKCKSSQPPTHPQKRKKFALLLIFCVRSLPQFFCPPRTFSSPSSLLLVLQSWTIKKRQHFQFVSFCFKSIIFSEEILGENTYKQEVAKKHYVVSGYKLIDTHHP